jgi:hypothetical protein
MGGINHQKCGGLWHCFNHIDHHFVSRDTTDIYWSSSLRPWHCFNSREEHGFDVFHLKAGQHRDSGTAARFCFLEKFSRFRNMYIYIFRCIIYIYIYINIIYIFTSLYIWAKYNNSLTWIVQQFWDGFPFFTMIPVRSQWGRYNLHRIYIYIFMWFV